MTAPEADPETTRSDTGLAHESMSQAEVMAQSVAGIAPSAVMATGPALIVLYAGQGAWLSYLAATVVVVLVGLCVAQFGRRFASSGSLYSYVARGLGPTGAFAAGWGLVIGYTCIAMVGVVGTGVYLGNFLDTIGLPATSTAGVIVLFIVAVVGAAAFAIAGIKISTRLGLVLEVVSVTAVLVVLVVALANNGITSGSSQFQLDGLTFDGVTFGIVLAVLGFVGFESAASLGAEARNPHRTIPRAVIGSAVLVGVLYVFATYASVVGFGGPETLGESAAPISDLADSNGLGGVRWIVDLGVTASFFAVIIASINAASRVLYTMGEEDVLPAALGRAHRRYKTPHVAIALIAPVVGLVPVLMVATGTTPFNVYAYTGTLGTFGYMLAYLLMAAALPFFLHRRGEGNAGSTVLAVVVVAALLYVFYKNVVPVPPAPFNLLPWIFLGALVVGLAWYFTVRLRRPEVVGEIGTVEEEPVPPGSAPVSRSGLGHPPGRTPGPDELPGPRARADDQADRQA
ncbi:APC family permease [Geodermatophilus ruber]|uniref:Amino acid/polyamine/organocation transporter, APC superfamily n=1 Tax=Geodermatophilus ruber TaxID=504800 RepID=A0A1I4E088_9ACTN|nr:APC family permease [Geodermatophilus ruber]SFK98619.1 amino acid/polyamine/organocation transporter, APC superfamily [Geodermatophilus ruber]